MKIAFLMGLTISGNSNGVKRQAETWANGLIELGHQVEFVSPWCQYDWPSFDIIHVFGFGTWLEIVPAIAERTNAKIVISPIIDTDRNHFLHKCASHFGVRALHMTSPLNSLRRIGKHVSMYYARSEYESQYLVRSFDVDPAKIEKIPLSCRLKQVEITAQKRANFCLHVSILSSKNKNVERLIAAAIKFNFDLVLAGSAGTKQFERELRARIRNHKNITYLGFLPDEELIALYSKAKVFALPSLFEGVGLVALEAAALGADIVLTNRGAPKEYYNNMAFLVDPDNIDEIGLSIVDVISGHTHQPDLSSFVLNNYKNERIVKYLERSYLELSDKYREV